MDSPAADNNPTTTLALRPHRTSGGGSGGGGGSGREDCWSEGATAVLIEAWGERHLRCNRGNLRQNDWLEVAEAVNSREDGSKPRKSDVQCKNRIDTLKKKYKVEKAKPVSSWPFFSRLDYLISPGGAKMPGGVQQETAAADGSGVLLPKNHPSRFRLNACPNPNPNSVRNSNPRLSGQWSGGSSSRFNSAYSSESESSLGGGENHGGSAGSGLIGEGRRGGGGAGRKHGRMEDHDNPPESTETAFRELARAILKFGEIYERIETSKQSQMMELEKQRMEFMKELELQRMNMIMEAQLEIEKLKRSKNSSTSGKKL